MVHTLHLTCHLVQIYVVYPTDLLVCDSNLPENQIQIRLPSIEIVISILEFLSL
jgi:hypothetical protein